MLHSMCLRAHLVACLIFMALARSAATQSSADKATSTSILAAAPAWDWATFDAGELLVMDLANGTRVVIALADAFAPAHVTNIRKLAHEHWYDGLVVERVQDNYVAQWGDPDDKKPLPRDVSRSIPAEYARPVVGLHLQPLPYRDTYAPIVGAVSAFPVAEEESSAWLTHCNGMVGVARGLNPDTGSGTGLYAVIGQSIRPLDRNIALVGRVVSGIEGLSSLPRGKGDLGFYTTPAERLPIRQVRLGSELTANDQPQIQRLRPESASYAAWVHARANRQDSFFIHPAEAADLCSLLPPIRPRVSSIALH